MKNPRDRQGGFGYIAAVVILVVFAGLATAMVKLGTTQQATSAQDIAAAQAWQTVRAGTEWGLYRALRTGNCNSTGQTLDFRSENGFSVTVTCTATPFNEGESAPTVALVKTIFSINAVACNSNACPDNVAAGSAAYVERRRIVTACATAAQEPCY